MPIPRSETKVALSLESFDAGIQVTGAIPFKCGTVRVLQDAISMETEKIISSLHVCLERPSCEQPSNPGRRRI